jgi:molybdopterin converting factor small subunit
MSTAQFKLLYFASASSYTQKSFEAFSAPSTAAKLFAELEEKYPGIKERILSSCMLTINLDYAELEQPEDVVISAGDEVAIIPPVSSG